ncbi:DNA cytosine methyltransferase [Paraburkholderia sp. SIMBA_027]|uniref:DNA cytosine methyltransferase n=1 Tax=Paraburkholderia sp. SIMBA_027 TaxID=3085770 RepID=UPI00397C19D0
MAAYYNEIEPYAAQWLRNLIAAGHIAPGDVDERSIEDVRPDDLRGYTQCHFFAGIGVWSSALRLAGWPDDRPVWTGSCPCQPFSAAGKGLGFADERHLWPAWHHLISECRPPVILGEQVASKDVDPWIDLVFDDLEAMEYACAANPFPSAGVGAPHIRDRSFFVAYAARERRNRRADPARIAGRLIAEANGAARGMADADDAGSQGRQRVRERAAECIARARGVVGRVADADLDRQPPRGLPVRPRPEGQGAPFESGSSEVNAAGPTNGFWRAADWLLCRDGKWRPVEPGTFPLAHGAPARVGRLRAYGNAINREAAAAFIAAADEAMTA